MPITDEKFDALVSSIKGLTSEIKADRRAKGDGTGAPSDTFGAGLSLQEREAILKKQLEGDISAQKSQQLNIELLHTRLELEQKARDSALATATTETDKIAAIEKYAEAVEKLEKELEGLQKQTDKYQGSAEGVSGAFETLTGVSRSFNTTLAGQAIGLFKSGQEMKKFGENLKETYTFGNIVEASMQKLGQTALLGFKNMFSELEEGTTSFIKATGASQKLTAAVMESSKAFREFGVTVADAGAAQAQLMATFPTRELGNITTEISAQFALWQKSGVAIGDSISSYDMLRRAFNMTDEDARDLQLNIMALGDEIGMGAPKMMQSFAEAAPRLAIHGENMVKIFKRTATASAQLGLEVSDVLALAEGFQTFEGSAQAAGRLNSILGGGFIDNIQLMNASFEDPAKAAQMIQDSFRAAGQTVESLGPAGVKAAAAAAGFSDVAKFTKFLNGQIDASELAADEELTMQKDMLAAAQGTQTILESFMSAFQSFFNDSLMSPLMDMLNFFKGFSGGAKAFIIGIGGAIGTVLMGTAGAILGGIIGAAEGAVVAPVLAAAVTGGEALGGSAGILKNLGTGIFQGTSMAGMGGMALTAAKFLGPIGAGLMVGKDALDLASGETSGANLGGTIGGAIGAIGFLGGPLVGAATMAAGNMLGEAVGEYYDKKIKADSEMPKVKSATDLRIDKLAEIVERQTTRDREMKIKLDVDEYAYRKGFRISTEEMLAQKG